MKGNSLVSHGGSLFGPLAQSRVSSYVRSGIVFSIFFFAVIIRVFHWQDNPTPPFHGMTGEYKAHAMVLVQGDVRGFLRGPNPPSNAHVIKHPPGYPLLMAAVYKLFGDADGVLRLIHILVDAGGVVLVFLIAYEFFSIPIAVLSGFLAALSPQLAYHSVALLPDPLAAPPLLLAIYLLIRAYKRPRLIVVFAAGVAIGVSCWFRSNTLLLPLFVCAALPLMFELGRRLRSAAALLAGFLLLVVPVTIRNGVFFRSFVPLSLSAGITLVEGIGAYDKDKKFGLPDSDYLVSKWEAQEFRRPDYLGDRFGVDGVMRERYRISRGLAVIKSHPLWFAGVMVQRAATMLRLARVELVRSQPPVRHSLSISAGAAPSFTVSPREAANLSTPGKVKLTITAEGSLRLEGRDSELFVFGPLPVQPRSDYLIKLPLKIKQGPVVIEVIDAGRNVILASSAVLHPVNWLDLTPEEQPASIVEVPFVSGEATNVKIELAMKGKTEPVTLELGTVEAFELGSASQTWTRYPRIVVGFLQRLFRTAVFLPFIFLAVIVLIRQRRWQELALLLVVPVYYMCLQSALWTEFRYILSMHYFLLILAAVGIVWTYEQLAWVGKKLQLGTGRHQPKT